MNLFAEALSALYHKNPVTLHLERDDGWRDTEELSWYLTSFRSFPAFEKQVLEFARGRVLDLGCGLGRHSLYLQKHGLPVTALDVSPQLVELARRRGVKDVRVGDMCRRLPFQDGELDTVLLFGNNLGICGALPKFRRMLRELYRVTGPQGRILATTRMPGTTNPVERAYLARNIAQGRPIGQMRIRYTLEDKQGDWFDVLFFSPTELMQIVSREGWRLAEVLTEIDFEDGYAVVLEKGERQSKD
ncbi:MAG: class I SAM-dependent methyltransferase [Anaerolineae bacterium]